MSSNLTKVSASELQIGMFVAQLDRPWTETPFLFQGFYIHHADEIEELKRYCAHVFVDPERSERSPQPEDDSRTIRRVTNLRKPSEVASDDGRKRPSYEVEVPIEEEMPAAKSIYKETVKAAKAIIDRLQQSGELDMELAEQAVAPVMDSVLRNPNAMTWLARMKLIDAYIYQHSVNSCVWGLAFGRHLGLDKQSIYEIGLGCMLFDVGKTQLSPMLLAKTGALTDAEMRVMRTHVEHGVAILR
ncbi:MAG TPA: DUF3391 domain-containing protein, partial [Gammaproteobacteria bacterium]|nr:DUF3391 domain-containing protein [Gammaproteobacteria bacterium]